MTVHHLSAQDKADLVTQIAEITEAATEAGRAWRVQMLHPAVDLYTAVVTVENDDA